MALKATHLACIELMIEQPTLTIHELAEKVGVNRNTVSDWRRNNEEFKAEYQKRLKDKWQDGEGVAVETMQELAKNGNFNAAKYILDNMGYNATQKIDANLSNDIVINIGE